MEPLIIGTGEMKRSSRIDVPLLLVLTAAIFPFTALIGWTLDAPLLESGGIPAATRMSPVTGVAQLFIVGAWILFFRFRSRPPARLLALCSLLISVFRLLEVATGRSTGFDYVLFHDRVLNQPHPNHIAPNAAVMILGLGLAILLAGEHQWRNELAAIVVLVTCAIPFFAILGYGGNLVSLYAIHLQTPMAFNTACCGLLLAIATLANLKNTRLLRPFWSETSGGLMARNLFPLALGIPIFTGLLLSLALNRGLIDKTTASTSFIVVVVILIAVVIHRTASRLDEFDEASALAAVRDMAELRDAKQAAELPAAPRAIFWLL